MKAWLLYDRAGAARNQDYIRYHRELGRELGIDFCVYEIDDWGEGTLPENAAADAPSFILVRTICPELNRILERNGFRVYNNYHVSRHANHKGRCLEYVRSHTSVPCVPVKTVPEPGDVLKPVDGHGGIGVRRVPDAEPCDGMDVRLWNPMTEDEDIYRNISTPYKLSDNEYICQPFISGAGEDVRVYVVGSRIVASVKRRAREGEFRANASLGGAVFPYELKPREREYVDQIIRLFAFGMAGIDFIVDGDGQFVFSEIEDVVGARMLYRVYPEIDILKEYLTWIVTEELS